MIHHITLRVSEFARSKAFYEKSLAPLGYGVVMEFTREQVPGLEVPATCAFGPPGRPVFWLRPADTLTPTHVAFAAKDHAGVDAFYAAALAAGAKDNGAPGLRPQYTPTYYGAFVLDPDGYNIEAVYLPSPGGD